MQKIAIDIGYGFTKVKTKDKEFKFASAVKTIPKYELDNYDKKDILSFNGKSYIVGDKVVRSATPSTDYSFIYEYAPILLVKALQIAGIKDTKFNLNTGLSLYDIDKQPEYDLSCKSRREEFIKRMSKFVVNDTEYTPNVSLFAQGQGAWYDYSLKNGFIKDGIDAVVDIGFRTNDVVIFEDGIPNKSASGADDNGVNVLTNILARYINKKYDIPVTHQECIKILDTKKITIYGKEKDLTPLINESLVEYIQELFHSLKANFGAWFVKAKRVIMVGGGAYLLVDYKNNFPPNVVFPKKDFEFLNVRGYYEGW